MKIMLIMTNYAKKFLTGASPFALAKSIRCVNVLCVYINEKLIHGTALGTLAKTAELNGINIMIYLVQLGTFLSAVVSYFQNYLPLRSSL